jgi:hypothetical protein
MVWLNPWRRMYGRRLLMNLAAVVADRLLLYGVARSFLEFVATAPERS